MHAVLLEIKGTMHSVHQSQKWRGGACGVESGAFSAPRPPNQWGEGLAAPFPRIPPPLSVIGLSMASNFGPLGLSAFLPTPVFWLCQWQWASGKLPSCGTELIGLWLSAGLRALTAAVDAVSGQILRVFGYSPSCNNAVCGVNVQCSLNSNAAVVCQAPTVL